MKNVKKRSFDSAQGEIFLKKDLHNGFSRYIMVNMNGNCTFCSAIQAAISLSLLLLRR